MSTWIQLTLSGEALAARGLAGGDSIKKTK